MAQQVQSSRVHIDSPERWRRALERSLQAGVEIFTVAGTSQLMATSATHLDRLYPVSATTCGCPAAIGGDPVCMHRAAARFVLGQLPDVEEQPQPCLWCHGSGLTPNHYHERYDNCDACGGSGVKPDHRLAGLPAVQPVARVAA